MKEYKIIRVELPATKFGADNKIAEWEKIMNKMAAQGWELHSSITQGMIIAFILEK